MKIYIKSSVVPNEVDDYIDVHILCDGGDSGDNAQKNSFYLEAYSSDGDTIWVGKTNDRGQPDYPDKYSLETAKQGHMYSDTNLYNVLDVMIEEFNLSRHDFVDIFNFARRYT